MKKVLLSISFLFVLSFFANAQSKSCCSGAAKSKSTSEASCATSSTDADKAASLDASIVKQVSNKGDVTYTRKEVDAASGKVNYVSVEYCSKTAKFMTKEDCSAKCTKEADSSKNSNEKSNKNSSKSVKS
jgi:hypothetical protein